MIRSFAFVLLMMLLMTPLASAANMQVNSSASPIAGGTITPNGIKYSATDITYTVTAKPGWSLASVKIDGVVASGAQVIDATHYKVLFNTSKVHTIVAYFAQTIYAITTTAGTGGTVSVTGGGSTNITPGSSRTVIVAPSTGYKIQNYIVDEGAPVVPANPTVAVSIPITNIQANHSISASFELIPVVTANAGADQTITTNQSGAASAELTGSATSNLGAITYQWNVMAKPSGTVATFGNGASLTTTFTVDRFGTYKVTLTATSGGVTITSAPATITVLTAPQAASITCTTCHAGQSQVVDWQASIHATSPSGASCPSCHMPSNEAHPGLITSTMGTICNNCHTDNQGNVPNHPLPIGTNPCVLCHNPHSTVATGGCGGCHDIPPATASHKKHYGGTVAQARYGDTRITQAFGNISTAYIFGCGNCHPMDASKHQNGAVDVELCNPLAPADSIKALNPASAAYVRGGEVLTDSSGLPYTKGTCSNVYCHSYNDWTTTAPIDSMDPNWQAKVVTTRHYKTITWGSTPLTCSGCHGNPTQTSYLTNDGGAGDSHSWMDEYGYQNLHTYNMGAPPVSCRYCHNDTVKQLNTYTEDGMGVRTLSGVPISSFSKHVNGSTDVAFDKQNPFVYPTSSGNIPMSLANATYDPGTKNCSNVSCHIHQTTVKWGTPYRWWDNNECNVCHQM